MKKVAVIGSGPGGLAVAVRLAILKFDVEVFESNAHPGGKINEFHSEGFRFDGGPSLFTLPALVDELFELAGKNPKDYFNYQKLDEVCRYFWEDQTRLTVSADNHDFDNRVSEVLNEKPGKILDYLKESAFKYDILSGLFIHKSLHKLSTWLSKDAFRGYLNIFSMGIFGTFNSFNKQSFSNPKTVQLFNRYATYNGSSPYNTPATMSIIPHLEYNIGAFLPEKGMYQIADALHKLALELGVKFHFNSKVERIVVANKLATALKTINGELKKFDAVVSNMDVTPTYLKLMPDQKPPMKTLNQEKSGSGLIFYWGINREFKELGLHNILFSKDYEKEFNHQFGLKDIFDDPTIYINITSKIIPSDAPEGSENWFVLINAPSNTGQEWEAITQKTKKAILEKIKRTLHIDLEPHIVTERILDPVKIETNTASSQGALYGNSSNNKYAAFLRHPNFSKEIQNLFFVGGSVHPGGGIPLAISSAKITSAILARSLKKSII
jgi:phytoene desaturase